MHMYCSNASTGPSMVFVLLSNLLEKKLNFHFFLSTYFYFFRFEFIIEGVIDGLKIQ